MAVMGWGQADVVRVRWKRGGSGTRERNSNPSVRWVAFLYRRRPAGATLPSVRHVAARSSRLVCWAKDMPQLFSRGRAHQQYPERRGASHESRSQTKSPAPTPCLPGGKAARSSWIDLRAFTLSLHPRIRPVLPRTMPLGVLSQPDNALSQGAVGTGHRSRRFAPLALRVAPLPFVDIIARAVLGAARTQTIMVGPDDPL